MMGNKSYPQVLDIVSTQNRNRTHAARLADQEEHT